MQPNKLGLRPVSTEALKVALRSLHRGDLTTPLTLEGLTRVGLQYTATELLEVLRGLDDSGVRAVLVAVLAERMPADGRWE